MIPPPTPRTAAGRELVRQDPQSAGFVLLIEQQAASPSAGLRAALLWVLETAQAITPTAGMPDPGREEWSRFSEACWQARAALKDQSAPVRAYCDHCDGVGWYEGGKSLQTQCERCYGTGWQDGKP